MNQEMWSKSLLASYNYLPTIAKCIERSNMQMALGSFSYQGNAVELMEKMIANNNRKRGLINAKVIVDTTLALLKEKNREVLKLRYIKRKSFEQIAEMLNICLRSVFRWHDIAIKQFSSMCRLRGYDEKWMEDNYSREELFERCALRCRQEESAKSEKQESGGGKVAETKTKSMLSERAKAKSKATLNIVGKIAAVTNGLKRAN